MYILIYVDDILITCSHKHAINDFLNRLHCDFAIKDLENLNFFLGMKAFNSQGQILLYQQCYILVILKRTKMHEAKPNGNPMASSTNLSALHSEDFNDITLF